MRTAIFAASLLALTGCVGAGGLKLQLDERKGAVEYVQSSSEVVRRPGTVGLTSFTVAQGLPDATTVERKGGYFVPLLFFNFWKNEYATTLGASQLTNDYVQFMRESLAEELRRHSRYAFAEGVGDLQLDVTVSKIEMKAPVVETGQAYFLLVVMGMGSQMNAAPAEVVITGEVAARRGGAEVLRRPVTGRGHARFAPEPRDRKRKIADYTAVMIAGLSKAIESFNEAVVAEVNAP